MAVHGVCGLANMGNTCFMNAGLQCLCSVPSITSFFLENRKMPETLEDSLHKHLQILRSFTLLLNKLWAGMFSCIHPGTFHQTFGLLHKQFGNYRQHDCQEFIAFLLDSLHEILAADALALKQSSVIQGKTSPDCERVSSRCEDLPTSDNVAIESTRLEDDSKSSESNSKKMDTEEVCGKDKKESNTKSSIITGTLQGTFKSLVECLSCGHVSVTFEPFMYLSLPIPRAMERQLVVTYMFDSSDHIPVRYMVTVHKAHFVVDLKMALIAMLPDDNKPDVKDVVLTEVYHWSIARILDDAFPLRFITSSLRQLVAFELIKPATPHVIQDVCMSDEYLSLSQTNHSQSLESDERRTHTDAKRPVGGDTIESHSVKRPHYLDTEGDVADSDSLQLDNHVPSSSNEKAADTYVLVNSPVSREPSNVSSSASLLAMTAGDISGLSTSLAGSLWHTCAICLEEMMERELMTHPSCGCLLCQPCLEMTKSHHGGNTFVCPVCLKDVPADSGFVCLSAGIQEEEIRHLYIPVEFKQVTAGRDSRLEYVRFVALLQLSSFMTCDELHQRICNLLYKKTGNISCLSFTVHVAYGLFPSYKSLIEQHPDILSRRKGVVELRPSDTVCVVFTSKLTPKMESKLCALVDHSSTQDEMSHSRTLTECFQAFIESEELGDDNTWYCPCCCSNQKARKTLLLRKLPNTLIVHLKRFVFEGMSGEKIDAFVDYPVEQLDMSQYVVEDDRQQNLVYDLISCVCHSGGLNSGHYTAHVKNPLSGMWYYLNDRIAVPELQPQVIPEVYILFYQRRDHMSLIHVRPRDELLAEWEREKHREMLAQQLDIQFEHEIPDMSPIVTDISTNPFLDSPTEGRTPPPQLSPLLPSTPVADGGAFIPMEEAAVELQPMSQAFHSQLASGQTLNQDEMEPLLGDGSDWTSSYPMYVTNSEDGESTSFFTSHDDANVVESLLGHHDVTTQWAIEQSFKTMDTNVSDHRVLYSHNDVVPSAGEEWSLLGEGNAWGTKQGDRLVGEGSPLKVSEGGDAHKQMWQLGDYQEH
ncbi:uncharacterized protein LOC134196378 isoform X2 [Corticium candelabrum]|nr:uncharacterized protein LOC134196378 isoform X2 [Corticium candelabrum]XP_062521472.1 uncharacterized protein LOC134196378 isoform X2 [Corticium candelabrum]XP_062521473.1 uncharacterized protein LOC134196378 isoform X2 [Corticium candelabrum]